MIRRNQREPACVTAVMEGLHRVVDPLFEGKAPSLRSTDPTSRLQDMRAFLNPQFKRQVVRAHKKSKKAFDKSIKKLHLELGRMLASEMAGRIRTDFPSFRQRVKSRLAKAHEQAFTKGREAAGLSRDEANLKKDPTAKARLDSLVKEELSYLDKFLDQVEQGEWKHGLPVQRIAHYVNSVAASYNTGRMMAMPATALIHWHLESGNPCPDCVLIAKHSPFTRELLPAVPRSGSTRCRHNCYCTLEIEVADERKIKRTRRGHVTRAKLLGMIKKQQSKSRKKKKRKAA